MNNINFLFLLIFKLAYTKFMDLTPEEFKMQYLSIVKPAKKNLKAEKISNVKLNFKSINWVDQGVVSEVKNQGQCGSCWAFSATGSLESLHAIKSGTMTLFSEQQLIDCSRNFGNNGCQGGLQQNAYEYIIYNGGITSESEYPYTAENGNCQQSESVYTIKNFQSISAGDVKYLASALQQQPIAIAVDASQWQLYGSGVFDNCGTKLDHGVLLVGYNNEYWTVKNSWGTGWGESGYIRTCSWKYMWFS